MALSKRMDVNGVPAEYHRVVSVTQVVNVQTVVEVGSYASAAAREAERAAREAGGRAAVRVEATLVWPAGGDGRPAYVPEMGAGAAYEYLKGLPEFEGAEDC